MKQLSHPKINIAVIDDYQVFQYFIKKILEENKKLNVGLQCLKGTLFYKSVLLIAAYS